jgi:hypothetical protein
MIMIKENTKSLEDQDINFKIGRSTLVYYEAAPCH